jgi:hypothetical protein
MRAYVAQMAQGIQPARAAFTSRRAAGTDRHTRRLVPQNRRGINNMPILFYLPFIVFSGMFSVATESMREPAKQRVKAKKD